MSTALEEVKGNAVLFSEMTPPDGGEDVFNAWYDGHHSPSHVQGVPGFISAMRYRSGIGPHYLAVYELTGPEALDDEEYRKRKLTPDDATRRMLDAVSGFTRYIANEAFCKARADSPVMPLDAPVIACVFYTVPMERRGAFESWYDGEYIPLLLRCPGWLMARRFDVLDCDPEPHTHLMLHYLDSEQALRSPEAVQANASEGWQKFAAEAWFAPVLVAYHRRNDRFLKSG